MTGEVTLIDKNEASDMRNPKMPYKSGRYNALDETCGDTNTYGDSCAPDELPSVTAQYFHGCRSFTGQEHERNEGEGREDIVVICQSDG